MRRSPWQTLVVASSLNFAFAVGPVAAAGPIASGEVVPGTIAGPGFTESWTFNGSAGQRIVIGALTTGGALNTNIVVVPPGGGAPVVNTSADRVEYQLLANGTHTLRIEDVGLDTPGTYNLSFLNITGGPHTTGGDPDGGAITSSQIKTGQMNAVTDFDAFTFTGAAGDRILIAGVATSGSLNTTFYLFPPAGGAAENSTTGDRMDHQLAQSGIYTIVMEDFSLDHTGGYTVSFLNLTDGPLTSASDPDGGFVTSAELHGGQMHDVGDFDAYRFSGSFGQRIVIGAVTTGGSLNTIIAVYPPSGAAVIYTSADRAEYQLLATGTHTIVIEDVGQDTQGSYSLTFLNISAGPFTASDDLDGGPLLSARSQAGQVNGATDFDAFTFSGTAGDRVLIAGLATGGALNTTFYLYPPGGGAAENSTTGDRMDHQLAQSGTYTIVMEDFANDETGSYILSLLNVTSGPLTWASDLDGGTIASAEILTGQMNETCDFDAYRFTGAFGDRVAVAALATGGALNTIIAIYPPFGAAVVYTSADRVEYQLQTTGTHTIVIEDVGLDSTGPFSVAFLNITAGPFATGGDTDGGPVVSAQSRTGQMHGVVDLDAYTFTGTAGDRVLIAGVATGGSLNTTYYLYPPGGGAAENSTTGDRIDHQLATSGTYTVVMEDFALDNTGAYVFSLLNLTSGPLTSGGDTDGGAFVSGEVRSGQTHAVGDFDAYRFTGTFGQRVVIGALTTSGTLNTIIGVYPPTGPAVVYTSADRAEYQLLATGTFTIVIEDVGLDETGAYTLAYTNITTGPHTTAGDLDGGAIASAEIKTGQMNGVVDFDAFTFTGGAGDRVLIGGLATSGSLNTTFYLYPPTGGPAENSTTADRLDHQLLSSGTYTVVMEDFGLDNTGTYSLTMLNVTSGPLTSGADPNGGTLAQGQLRTGQISPVPDFDAYAFYGTVGDTARISGVTTSGLLNTNIGLYPPGGAAAVVYTSADLATHVLTSTGYYTVVMEDVALDHTGAYEIRVTGAGGVVGIGDGPDGGVISDRAVLHPGSPTPFADATTIGFALPAGLPVELRIFDVRGALVRTLTRGSLEAGPHRAVWDGRGDGGARVPSGVYYAELRAGRDVLRRRLVLVK